MEKDFQSKSSINRKLIIIWDSPRFLNESGTRVKPEKLGQYLEIYQGCFYQILIVFFVSI
jgi:hypothetical protein